MKIVTIAAAALTSTLLLSSASTAAPYQLSSTGTCTAATCTITFASVPSGKTAELTNVSCYARAPYNLGASEVRKVTLQQLTASGGTGVTVTLAPAPYLLGSSTPATAQSVWVISQPVTLYATGGQKFRVRAELTSGRFSELNCHVSGKI